MKVKYQAADDVTVSGNLLWRGIGYGLAITAAVGLVSWGGYELKWAVRSNSTQRSSQINRESLGFQQARVDDINNKLNDIAGLDTDIAVTTDPAAVTALKSQKTAVVNLACADWNQLTTAYQGALSVSQQNELSQLCAAPVNP